MMSDERLLDFCRALAASVRSGLPLSSAFATLSKSAAHGGAMAGAAKLTAGGASLHEALKAQGIFSPVFIALIRAGEEGGKVDEFLDLFADCLEVRIEFRRRIGRALIYPAFAIVLAGALFLVFSFKVVPLILEPFLSAGIAVPSPAPWLNRLAEYWPQTIVFILLLGLAFRAFLRSGPGRKLWALAGHWLPGFRFATEQAGFYHIYTTMALLLKAGLPLSAMMDVLLQFSQDDPVTRRRLSSASTMLSYGGSFSGSLSDCIPPQDRCALEIAEKAGRLEETLLRLGKVHHDLHLHRLKVLAAVCKISALAALAPLCFALILTLLRPILSVLNVLKGFSPGGGSFDTVVPAARSTPPDGAGPRGMFSGFEVAEDTRTALFNEAHGGQIAEFMKKYAVKAQPGPGPGARPEKAGAPKKLGPIPPIKKLRSRNITPTAIQPSGLGGSGNFRR